MVLPLAPLKKKKTVTQDTFLTVSDLSSYLEPYLLGQYPKYVKGDKYSVYHGTTVQKSLVTMCCHYFNQPTFAM